MKTFQSLNTVGINGKSYGKNISITPITSIVSGLLTEILILPIKKNKKKIFAGVKFRGKYSKRDKLLVLVARYQPKGVS